MNPNSSLTRRRNNEIWFGCFRGSDGCFLNHSGHVIYSRTRGRKTKRHLLDGLRSNVYYPSSHLNLLQIENKENNQRAGTVESLCLSSEGRRQNNDEAVIGSDPLMALNEAPAAGDKSRLQQESEERLGHREHSETSQTRNWH